MRRHPRRSATAHLAAIALLICGCGTVGLLVGRAVRISSAQASTERATAATSAFRRAEALSYPAGWRTGYHAGWARAAAVARARARRAGHVSARRRTDSRAAAASLVAAAQRALTTAYGAGVAPRPTRKCVEVGEGLCEVLGPAAGHRPCPAGSVPDPVRGVVCVPRLLIEVEEQASRTMGALAPAP